MDIREKIDEYIDRKKYEIVSRTCDLIKIPSINTSDDSGKPYGRKCAEALDYLYNICTEKNLGVNNMDYHCLEIKCDDNFSGKRLVIAVHADVVPTEDENIYDPFAGRVYGDYIIGRGSVDDKGPLMACLYAMAFFKEYDIPLNNDVRLFIGSNEECGMDDLKYYIERAGMPDWGLAVDDDFPTVNGEKGMIQFTVSVPKSEYVEYINSYGTAERIIHDSCETMINGKNAVLKRSEKISNPVQYILEKSDVSLFADRKDEEIIKELLSEKAASVIGIDYTDELSGGTRIKVFSVRTVGENFKISFDVRIPVLKNVSEVKEKIISYSEVRGIEIEIIREEKGYYLSKNSDMIKLLTDVYNNEMNSNDSPYIMSGCTYARVFDFGCGFGAGNPHETKPFPTGHGGCHGPDEAHNINVLLNAVKLIILGIKAIDDRWSI